MLRELYALLCPRSSDSSTLSRCHAAGISTLYARLAPSSRARNADAASPPSVAGARAIVVARVGVDGARDRRRRFGSPVRVVSFRIHETGPCFARLPVRDARRATPRTPTPRPRARRGERPRAEAPRSRSRTRERANARTTRERRTTRREREIFWISKSIAKELRGDARRD